MKLKPIAILLISISFLQPVFSLAADPAQSPGAPLADSGPDLSGLSASEDMSLTLPGAEYIAGKAKGVVLMRVNLWGGVQRPGIYHVPIGTDVIKLISYAGGPSARAELDDVRLQREDGGKQKNLQVDVDSIVKGKQPRTEDYNPLLKIDDIVVVPQSHPLLSENAIIVLTALATISSLIVAGVYVRSQTH